MKQSTKVTAALLAGSTFLSVPAWAQESFYTKAAEPYAGTTIRILDEVTPLQEKVFDIIPQFEELTGITVELELLGHAEVINRGQADMLSGRGFYDGVMMHNYQLAPMLTAGVIRSIDDYVADPALSDPDFNADDLIQRPYTTTSFTGGKQYGFNNWNYNEVYWARADLFAHPEEQAAFNEKYGYDLGPAETITQMRDIAEFFTRDAGETLAGETLEADFYGIVLEGIKGGSTFPTLWSALIKNYGGRLLDENGAPAFDSPETVEALTMWAELWSFAPPGIAEYSLVDVPTVMGNGLAAQTLAWSDFVFGVDVPGASPYAGDFVYGPIPFKEGREEERSVEADVSVVVISEASENPEATFLFLQWLASEEAQAALIEAGNGGVPIRQSSWELPAIADSEMTSLYAAMRSTLDVAEAKPKMPDSFEIMDAMSGIAQEVGLGRLTPEEGAAQGQAAMLEICTQCLMQ